MTTQQRQKIQELISQVKAARYYEHKKDIDGLKELLRLNYYPKPTNGGILNIVERVEGKLFVHSVDVEIPESDKNV